VAAMAEDGDHSDEDGKDGDAEGDGLKRLVAFAGFLHLVGEFLDFIGFHSGMILARLLWRSRRLGLVEIVG
jgi:hypothetical protein